MVVCCIAVTLSVAGGGLLLFTIGLGVGLCVVLLASACFRDFRGCGLIIVVFRVC